MGPAVVAFLFGISTAVWVYSKFVKGHGEANVRNNVVGAAIVGIVAFVVAFTVMRSLI
jgi:lipopolysaccharide export LptBFGC system permease protein LptF